MKKIAVIGGGISGLSLAQSLAQDFQVKVFEKESLPGGLVKCKRVDGNLYHMVGGHVFNSKRQDVLDFFWSFFNKEKEFKKAVRNAVIYFDKPVGYPIENHLHQLNQDDAKNIISDLLHINNDTSVKNEENFEDFLKNRFGQTLYNLYFKPYNEKIWKKDLSKIPLGWLEGKLPMPTVSDILCANIIQEKEMQMVHSTFYYPNNDGSQFLVNRLAEGLDITYNSEITSINKNKVSGQWEINDDYSCDYIVYTGNIKELKEIWQKPEDCSTSLQEIDKLESHGTTSVLCEVEPSPYSWVYLPQKEIMSHRIINTGNFAESNNKKGVKTATLEFTDQVRMQEIEKNISKTPFTPKYLSHQYTKYTYPIQNVDTRKLITDLKEQSEPLGLFLLGRFAEWEYYNMDAAMGAALDLGNRIVKESSEVN